MTLKKLVLQNFRSYKKRSFTFSKTATLIIGSNAAGKTNIVEAIMFLAIGKSFRAEHDRDAVWWDAEVGHITSHIAKNGNTIYLALTLTRGIVSGKRVPTKKYQVNGVTRRNIDFVGNFHAVLFWPEDMQLIIGSPFRRRHYLDSVLIQIDREYQRSLRSYERGLRQRNKLLKQIRDGTAMRSALLFWNQLVIKTGQYLNKKRAEYITFINSASWFEDKEHQFHIIYDESPISYRRLEQYADAEIGAAVTLVGPHRDEIKFKVGDNPSLKERDLAVFGSRGEQRLGVLWLKLAELAYIEKETGEKPVLLLDDIFSELDYEHRELVFSLFSKQQTIATTADPQVIPEKYQKDMEVVELQ